MHSLLHRGTERRRAGQLAEARSAFLAAANIAEAERDRSALVAAALGAGGIWVQEERDVVARAVLQDLWCKAAAVVPPESLDGARLAVRLAAETAYEGGPLEAVLAALADVRRFGDDTATAESLSLLHHVQLGPRYAEARLRVAEELIAVGARAHDTFFCLMGLCWRTVDLFLLGDPRAAQSLHELRERSAAASCEALEFIADVLEAMTIARSGRFEQAETAATLAAQRGRALGDPDAPAYFGAMLAALRWWQGREPEIIDLVRDTSSSPRLGQNGHVYVAAGALLSASLGDFDGAEETLARLNGASLKSLPDSSSWLTTLFLVAETAYLVGDVQTAATVVDLLSPYGHLPVMPSLAVVCFGSAERSLGLCAATAGDLDAAIHHLEHAIDADRRLGNRPMAVLTEHVLSRILHVRRRPDDEHRSRQLATLARDRAMRMGMVLPDHPTWLTACERRLQRHPNEASLQRVPRGWRIVVDARATVLPDRVGFQYLAQLVARPDKDCDVLDLATAGVLPTEHSDEVVDGRALTSYRRRVAELSELLNDGRISPEAAERHRRELVVLTAALRSAVGLGGRTRSFPGNDERARTAVRKALMRAIDTITSAEPELGAHLRARVVTGVTCRYSSAPDWDLRVLRDESSA
jgi:tetratricopeptide (TPR) repeat protein